MAFARPLAVAIFGLALSSAAHAVSITDGSLTVNIDADGSFDVITLNGATFDSSAFFQAQYTSGASGVGASTAVTAAGPLATYAGTIAGLNVSVTSRVLGGLASSPATTNVLQQVFTYTNTGTVPVALNSISYTDPDLSDIGSDTVRYDATRNAVVSNNGTFLYATIANATTAGAVPGHDVGSLGSVSTNFPMANRNGPTGPADTAVSIGYDLGTLGIGQSLTVEFRHLFASGISTVPADFSIPEPTSLAGLGLAVAGLLSRRRRA